MGNCKSKKTQYTPPPADQTAPSGGRVDPPKQRATPQARTDHHSGGQHHSGHSHRHHHGHHGHTKPTATHHYKKNQHVLQRMEDPSTLRGQMAAIRSAIAGAQLQNMVKKHSVNSADSITDTYDGMPKPGNPGKLLGEGATGKVYRVTHKLSGKTFACKVVALPRSMPAEKRAEFIAEVDMIKMLDHPNTVKVTEVYEKRTELQIVMEECTGGELFDKLYAQPENKFLEKDTKRLISQMLKSLAYLHANNIAHRDLKLENFLFSTKEDDATVKVIDFGFSKAGAGHHMKKFVGTCYYMAPEVIGRDYGHECDLWSLGVICFMMLTGEVPFNGPGQNPSPQSIIEKIKTAAGIGQAYVDKRVDTVFKRHGISEACTDFVQGLLQIDVPARMTASGALHHEWFTAPDSRAHAARTKSVETGTAHNQSVVSQIMAFRNKNVVQRSAFMAMTFGMAGPELAALGKTFRDSDTDHNGVLSLEEFTTMMQSVEMGRGMSTEDIQNAFGAIDQDGEGSIQYSEFIAAALDTSATAQESAVEAAFQKLDLDSEGTITPDELKQVLPPGLDEEAVNNILDAADSDGDGAICLAEFKAMIHGKGLGKKMNMSPSFSTLNMRTVSSVNREEEAKGSKWGVAKKSIKAHTSFQVHGGIMRKVTKL